MFGWRKRNEGFEWRQYVRTTILVRRQDRRQRLAQAGDAALGSLQAAGRKGALAGTSAVQAATSRMAAGATGLGGNLAAGARRALAVATRGLDGAGVGLKSAARVAGRSLRGGCLELDRPALALLFVGIGAVAGLAALTTASLIVQAGGRFDATLLALTVVALAALLFFAAPAWLAGTGRRWAAVKARGSDAADVAGAMADAVGARIRHLPGTQRFQSARLGHAVLLGLGLLAAGTTIGLTARIRMALPVRAAGGGSHADAHGAGLKGRASALPGGLLRIGATLVKLQDIEVPDPGQRCTRDGTARLWSCGENATQVLVRLIRGRRVACTIANQGAGYATGRCDAGGTDLGAELVKSGAVFAMTGLLAAYTSQEQAARAGKLGLWGGTNERPEIWRAKRWAAAKQAAPDGCPIKGQVGAKGKIYVLPWARAYELVKVRANRGERWFCSEDEALSAGWRPVERL